VAALVVSVLPAACFFLQAGAGLATVTGPSLYLTDTDSHGRLAGLGAAAPEAPAAHSTVLSWMLAPNSMGETSLQCYN